MINNQAHSCHAQDNISDGFSMQQIDAYDSTTKYKYKYTTSDNHHAIIDNHHNHHATANNTQPSSTITVEQRRVGKQHHLRWSEPLHSTAPSHTHQQPPSNGNLSTPITANIDGLAQTINEDPFLTRRGKVPTYSTNNPFMFFTQHTVNVILQHPTIDDQPYYQAALMAHSQPFPTYQQLRSPFTPNLLKAHQWPSGPYMKTSRNPKRGRKWKESTQVAL